MIKEELPRISIFSKGIQVRGSLRVNFILSLSGMISIVALRVNFIIKSDWHANYSMFMLEILFH